MVQWNENLRERERSGLQTQIDGFYTGCQVYVASHCHITTKLFSRVELGIYCKLLVSACCLTNHYNSSYVMTYPMLVDTHDLSILINMVNEIFLVA